MVTLNTCCGIVCLTLQLSDMITRISIQTAGLAFGGTGLCTYRVRGVDSSCAEHLTVESSVDYADSCWLSSAR